VSHSKTVIYNRLRMYDLKTIFYSPNYKNAIAPYSKTVLQNHLRWHVVNTMFSSSELINELLKIRLISHKNISSNHIFCYESFIPKQSIDTFKPLVYYSK